MTQIEIEDLFCKRLKDDGYLPEPTYVLFINKHWDNLQELKQKFCYEHGLYFVDLEIRQFLQRGIMKFVGSLK